MSIATRLSGLSAEELGRLEQDFLEIPQLEQAFPNFPESPGTMNPQSTTTIKQEVPAATTKISTTTSNANKAVRLVPQSSGSKGNHARQSAGIKEPVMDAKRTKLKEQFLDRTQMPTPTTSTSISNKAVRLVPQNFGSKGTYDKLQAGKKKEKRQARRLATVEKATPRRTQQKAISWGKALVREYNLIPGDHPACGQFALTLDWAHSETIIKELSDPPKRRPRRLDTDARRKRLTALCDKEQDDKAAAKAILEDKNWSWLKGTPLDGAPLEALHALQGRFEGTVTKAQAVARGYLVRRRNNVADYLSCVKGTALEGASLEIIQAFEANVHALLMEEWLLEEANNYGASNEDFDDDLDEYLFMDPLHVRATMRAMLLAIKEEEKQAKRKKQSKAQQQGIVSTFEKLFLASTRVDNLDILEQALVRCQARARGFLTRRSLRRRFGVRFSACDRWLHSDEFLEKFFDMSFRVIRHPKDNGKQWRLQQEEQQRLHGTVISPTKWQKPRKVRFTWTQTVHYMEGYCQIGYRVDPTLTGKEWRSRHFHSHRKLIELEEDEKALLEYQAAQRRLEQKEQRRLEQQQYHKQFQRILQEGHQKLETQRVLYQKALQHQAAEIRRQFAVILARKGLRKKKPRRSNPHSPVPIPVPAPTKRDDRTTAVIPKFPRTNGSHHPCTASIHSTVQRAKLPLTSTITGQQLNPAQQTPIHRKALRQQPYGILTQQQSLNPAQQTPIHRKALRQQPFGTTGKRGIPWHQAWISPAHRKTLRQQPF
jgi:hypothetical protein